jgi:hypothetical protein
MLETSDGLAMLCGQRKGKTMSAIQTELIDLTQGEYEAFLTRELQAAVGVDVPTFLKDYATGKLDEADPEVARLAALLGLGQNGR